MPLRFAAWLLGAAFATLVALAVFLPLYFDPNDYKQVLADRVEQATGRKLTIAGDVDLNVFPWLAITLRDARLANAAGFGDSPFAEVDELRASVHVLPLLRKEVEIGTVSLDGLLLRLAKDASGRNNWQDVREHRAARKAEDDGPAQPGRFRIKSLDIAGIEVENSAVEWSNASGRSYRLADVYFSTGSLRPGAAFDLDGGFVLTSPATPDRRTEVELAGRIEPAGKDQYKVNGLELTANAGGLAEDEQEIRFTADVDYHARKQELNATRFVLNALGEEASGSLRASSVLDAPKFSGRIAADSISPRKLMRSFGASAPGSSAALNAASFRAAFAGDRRRVDFSEVSLRLDSTHMNGTAYVTQFNKPLIGFDLRVDAIDLNRYVGGGGGGKGASTGGGAGEPTELKGRLRVGSLKLRKLQFHNADLYLHAKNGEINVSPMTAGFYQGRVSGSGRFNTRASSYSVNATMNGIRTEKLMMDLTGKAPVDGAGNVKLNLRGSGAGARAMDGTVAFDIRNGELNGVDLPYKLRQAYALYEGRKLADAGRAATPFSVLAATLNVNDGVLSSNNLDGRTPGIDVDAGGQASLVSRTLNFLAQVGITGAPAGQDWPEFEKLKGLTVPVQIYGSFSNPQWKVNLAGLLRGLVGSELREELDERLEEEKDKLRAKITERLQEEQLESSLGERLRKLTGIEERKVEKADVAAMEEKQKTTTPEASAEEKAAEEAARAERRAKQEAERAKRREARLAKQKAAQEARARKKAEAEAAASESSDL